MTDDAGLPADYTVRRLLRMTEAELEDLKRTAAAQGFSVSSYMRFRVFGRGKNTKGTRRPSELIELLGKWLGAFHTQGSDLHQIAKTYHQSEQDEIGLTGYIRQCMPIVDALAALLSAKFQLVVDDSEDARETDISALNVPKSPSLPPFTTQSLPPCMPQSALSRYAVLTNIPAQKPASAASFSGKDGGDG